jgi:hypothetical protein
VSDPVRERQRERIWPKVLMRAARRDQAVANAQKQSDINVVEYARIVWLAEEAMTLALRMARGEW